MNIKKYFRLNNKEIRYITATRKKKFVRWKILNINLIDQYKNINYNKLAISISSKFHKKAVYRNIIRKIFFDIIYKNSYVKKTTKFGYKKIYVSFKKWVEYDVKAEDFREKIRIDLEKDLEKIWND